MATKRNIVDMLEQPVNNQVVRKGQPFQLSTVEPEPTEEILEPRVEETKKPRRRAVAPPPNKLAKREKTNLEIRSDLWKKVRMYSAEERIPRYQIIEDALNLYFQKLKK